MSLQTLTFTKTYSVTHGGSGESYATWTPTLTADEQGQISNLLNDGYKFTGAHGFFGTKLTNNYKFIVYTGPAGSLDSDHLTLTSKLMPVFSYVHQSSNVLDSYLMEDGDGTEAHPSNTTATAGLEFNLYIQELNFNLPTISFYYGRRGLSYQDTANIDFTITYYLQDSYIAPSGVSEVTFGSAGVASFSEGAYTYGPILDSSLDPAGYHWEGWSTPTVTELKNMVTDGSVAVKGSFGKIHYKIKYYVNNVLWQTQECEGDTTYQYLTPPPSDDPGYISWGWAEANTNNQYIEYLQPGPNKLGRFAGVLNNSTGFLLTPLKTRFPSRAILTSTSSSEPGISQKYRPGNSFYNLLKHNQTLICYGTNNTVPFMYEVTLIETTGAVTYGFSYYGQPIALQPTITTDGYTNDYWYDKQNNKYETLPANLTTAQHQSKYNTGYTLIGNETYYVHKIPNEYTVSIRVNPEGPSVSINTPDKGTFTFDTDTIILSAIETETERFQYWSNDQNDDIIATPNYSYLNTIPANTIWTAHYLFLKPDLLFFNGNKQILGGFYFDKEGNQYPLSALVSPKHNQSTFSKFNIVESATTHSYDIPADNVSLISSSSTHTLGPPELAVLHTTKAVTSSTATIAAETLEYLFDDINNFLYNGYISNISCSITATRGGSYNPTVQATLYYEDDPISNSVQLSSEVRTTLKPTTIQPQYDLNKIKLKVEIKNSSSSVRIAQLYLTATYTPYILEKISSDEENEETIE